MKTSLKIGAFCLALLAVSSCKDKTEELPEVYSKIYNATSITLDGDYVIIKTTGVPDHKSPYFKGTQWESAQYEDYTGSNPDYTKNPNSISSFDMEFKIPVSPKKASSHASTPMGPMGVAINGVAMFNQYAAPGDQLENEIKTFDQYNGHPQNAGQYHYHLEPAYLTNLKGKDALLGFLLDGFPVYGPYENGKEITNGDLDEYHGHTSVTADYPDGIYHYHITAADPYINGDGFYGTAGTVSY